MGHWGSVRKSGGFFQDRFKIFFSPLTKPAWFVSF